MVDVHTVGAGGGSIGWRDPGGALRVGPRSAGADPGPACYGRGGAEPTVTDANLLLGYLAADSSLAGGVALDADAAGAAIGALAALARPRRAGDRRGDRPRRQPGDGAGAARRHGRARRRPAPLRAAALRRRRPDARRGARRRARHRAILCPRAGGVLSALGLCASDRRRDTTRTVMLSGAELSAERIAARGRRADRAGWDGDLAGAEPEVVYEMRYARPGLRAVGPGARRSRPRRPRRALRAAHEERYGYRDPDGEVVLVDIRLAMVVPGPRAAARGRARRAPRARAPAPPASTASGSRRPRPARRAAGRHPGRGPGDLRAARGDLRPPARLARRGRRRHRRHDPTRRLRADERDRTPVHACRCWSAACAPPATRWARS